MSNRIKGIRPMRGGIQIRYQHKGQRFEENLPLPWTDANVVAAVRIRGERLANIKAGKPPIPAEKTEPAPKPVGWVKRTFAEVAQEYLDYVLEAAEDDDFRLKRSTRNSNKNLLNRHWLAELGAQSIDTLTLEDLKEVAKQQWASRKTRKNAYSALRQVFAYAAHEDRGYVSENPAEGLRITSKKRRQKPRPDPYTAEDRDTLLRWLKANEAQYAYTYFLLAFYTGMRTSELLGLTWDDYRDGTFRVHRGRVRSEMTDSTKTDEERSVIVPSWVCREINTLPSRFKKGYVFLNQYGRPYLSGFHLNKAFTRAHEATDVTRSRSPNYPWRHTYCSIGLTNGGQPAFLASQTGHSLEMFYSTYAKWIEGDDDRDAIEEAFPEPKMGAEMGAND